VTGDDELGRHTRFRGELRARGECYVLGVSYNTTMRDLEAPLPEYQGCGRRPKAPWQSVSAWRQSLGPNGWTRLTVRDGEKGPVGIAMVTRRVQTRLERKRTGPEEWLVVTRRPLSDDRILEGISSPDATEHDGRYGYRYYLTPTRMSAVELKEPSLAERARVIKAGLGIEARFQRGKGEAGMDEYQVRQQFPHSTQFSGKEYHRSSKASRREDLQVEEPVACWDCSSFDFHPTLAGMLRTPLVGHKVVQMGEPAQKRLLAAFGMMEALHHAQLPLDGVMGLIQHGARHRHLGICKHRIPAHLFLLHPAPHPLPIGHPGLLRHVVGEVA
jgi:hypothetical protein